GAAVRDLIVPLVGILTGEERADGLSDRARLILEDGQAVLGTVAHHLRRVIHRGDVDRDRVLILFAGAGAGEPRIVPVQAVVVGGDGQRRDAVVIERVQAAA